MSGAEHWLEWAGGSGPLPSEGPRLKASFLPSALRRRCSGISRAALEAAFACLEPGERSNVRSVFASRHGETLTTESLLRTLGRDEVPSPMEFSLSVHNTTSGLFSIAAANRCASSAVAAGSRTLEAGLFEANNAMLAGSGREGVLCVFADEPIPGIFRANPDEQAPFFSFAFHLVPERAGLPLLTIRRADGPGAAPRAEELCEFARWLFSPRPGRGEFLTGAFEISRDGPDLVDSFTPVMAEG